MKVYIAASDALKAYGLEQYLKNNLQIRISDFIASWVPLGMQSSPSKRQTGIQKSESVEKNFTDIKSCDVLVLITDHDPVPGGKWVDFGYALALGKRVIVLGGRHENRYTYFEKVEHVDNAQGLVTLLST